MQKILTAFKEHCALPDLPRTLAPKLRQAGFQVEAQEVIVQFNPRFDANSYSYHAVDIIKSFVPGRKGMDAAEADLWADDLRTLGARSLAFVYYTMGDCARAEPLYRRSLEIWEKARGPDHPDTAICLMYLANLYVAMGDYARAEPLHRRSLEIFEKARGPDHPDTAFALNNLAQVYSTMGDYARAEPLHLRSLKITEKTFGPNHPDTASALNTLGSLYRTMGDYSRAEPLYAEPGDLGESPRTRPSRNRAGPDRPGAAVSEIEIQGRQVFSHLGLRRSRSQRQHLGIALHHPGQDHLV